MSIVEDTERTRFCPQMDRRTDGQGDTSIPPFQLRWSGGYKKCHPFTLFPTFDSRTYDRHEAYSHFLHDRSWISPWIKSIYNELDIAIHVIASQLSGHYDVISNRLWRHWRNKNWARETPGRYSLHRRFFSSFMESLCRVRNDVCHSWRIVSAPTPVLFWCLFPSLLQNSGNKHQNNPLVSAEKARHSRTEFLYSFPIFFQGSVLPMMEILIRLRHDRRRKENCCLCPAA